MRLQLRSIVAAVALFIASSFQLQAIDIYVLSGLSSASTTSTNFGKIDSTTGTYTNITSGVPSNIVQNLAWNPAISAFYVTENLGAGSNLRTLTTTGAISSQIGSNIGKFVYGMAYRPTDNTLYAYDYNGDATGTISPTTGGWSGLNGSPGLSSGSPSGGRYTMMDDSIYMTAINGSNGVFGTMGFTNTSTFSQIGSTNALFNNMFPASDGTSLYGVYSDGTVGNQKLYSINPTTGVPTFLTNVSGTDLGRNFFGAAIVTVPEPSTYALATIATGVMAAVARRRKAKRA